MIAIDGVAYASDTDRGKAALSWAREVYPRWAAVEWAMTAHTGDPWYQAALLYMMAGMTPAAISEATHYSLSTISRMLATAAATLGAELCDGPWHDP